MLQNSAHHQRSSGLDQLSTLVTSMEAITIPQQLLRTRQNRVSEQARLPLPTLEHRLPHHGTARISAPKAFLRHTGRLLYH